MRENDEGQLPAESAIARSRKELLPFLVDAELVFEVMFASAWGAFWLDAGIRSTTGRSLLGAASPVRPSYLVTDGRLQEVVDGRVRPVAGTLHGRMRAELEWARGSAQGMPSGHPTPVPEADASAEASPLGWVGWLGYEYGAALVDADLVTPGAADAAPGETRTSIPDAVLLAADRIVSIDHALGETCLWFVDDEDGRAWAERTRHELERLASDPTPVRRPSGGDGRSIGTPRWRNSDDEYLRMIASCQESIHAGDAYQLCLTTQVSVTTDEDPFEVYRRVRRGSLAGHGGYIRVGEAALLSASPELYLTVGDGVAVSRPVKGTRRRGKTGTEDVELRTELAADEKERAENLMIVDLMRNDLGRVARLGGVSVTELLQVETHEHVHQLVSTIRAELAEGTDVFDVLEASFPAGSMTGAPKLSAMRILHGLEAGRRGVYSGCFGRIGLDGSAELAMVIRSIVMRDGRATIGTGGGITALSVPQNELAEVKLKAAALLAALGA
ncbi:anthranilate synthase component I family protein [Rathayibacter sp. CAU 1779]